MTKKVYHVDSLSTAEVRALGRTLNALCISWERVKVRGKGVCVELMADQDQLDELRRRWHG